MKVKLSEIRRKVESWELNVETMTLNALQKGKTDEPCAYWHS